ncbi:MAG TPA: tetratricopeptide repeat-containing glycosyltransferase family protein [Candidatus Sulfotelmatobacter sp.]|nr:tetratricopeptide repeat-containing glycosyltransferase family protein [Candidatus Sulfotelmatobacter sp.]
MIDSASSFRHEALRLLQSGRPREAEAVLRRLLLSDMGWAPAYCLLAQAAHMQGRRMEAVTLAGHAAELAPDLAENHFMLGVALMGMNALERAHDAFEAALRADPSLAEAHLNLGNVDKLQKRPDAAAEHYRRALELRPAMAEGHLNLGTLLRDQGDYVGAEQAARRALEAMPGVVGGYLNLGNALSEQGRYAEAVEAYHRHLEQVPGDVANWVTLGANLAALGRRDEALAAHDRAVALAPDDGLQRFERSVTRLLFGDFAGGWADYECRWSKPSLKAERPNLPGREWRGEDIGGKTLFVFGEQGYGDNIQFARYLPLLVERGAKVVFCSEKTLSSLFEPMMGRGIQWYDGDGPVPPYHYYVPLLSLPHHFGTLLETIPLPAPYLTPSQARRDAWRERIAACKPGKNLKVGLVWTGRPVHGNDKERSLSPDLLKPVLDQRGICFFSLQKPSRPGHMEVLQSLGRVHDLSLQLEDFADTAAALENLDLLISVDTAVAHLAGALGRPAWVLIARHPDWRWLRERDDSPWYPSLRLYRQPTKRDWPSVIARLAEDLSKLVLMEKAKRG